MSHSAYTNLEGHLLERLRLMRPLIFRPLNQSVLLFSLGLVTFLFFGLESQAQTDTVKTFVFSSPSRSGVFLFPNDPSKTYEKIKMLYRMRCKNGLVSNSSNRNQGCGEWDYSCNTYLTDSSLTDSVKATQSDYVITGFSGSAFNFSTNPTYDYFEYKQKITSVSGVSEDTIASVSSGTISISDPLSGHKTNSKSQFLWTATELAASGLTPGKINALHFDLSQLGTAVHFLRIKMKSTLKTELTSIEDSSGFYPVYFQNTTFSALGNQALRFYRPYLWDGVSNLILELNYSNTEDSTGNLIKGGTPTFNAAISNPVDDYFLDLDGSQGRIDCGDIDALDNAPKLTFEAWVNIKTWQNWKNIFGDNDKTNIQLGDNAGQLYCIVRNTTNTYGYANNVIPLNTWTHVAMVYDGSQPTNIGRLKLYINGIQKALTFSGNIPAVTQDNSTPLLIGQGVNGRLDEARVWNEAISAAAIQGWMRKKASNQHPNFANLQVAYSMDEGLGQVVSDASSFNRPGQILGNTQWAIFKGNDLLKNLSPISTRPTIGFVRNNYSLSVNEVALLDSVPKISNTVVHYQLMNGQPIAVDTSYLFAAGTQNVYNENGVVIRTIPSANNGTILISTLDFFKKTAQKVELISFVTPYGIGLNFGTQGKVWEFDMTDYVHQLKGLKRLTMERGGENQEDMDIQFVFYEGTPARNVLSLQQIWPVTHSSYSDINANKVYEPRTLKMNANASTFKIRSAITGHGQEGEFIPRSHNLNLNGGPAEFQWDVWKGCSLNPIIAQGGTWVYDRAGWCPGAPTDLQEWNATPYLTVGQDATFDYGVSNAPGDSRYIANHQLVQYGGENFALDAAVVQVAAPGTLTEFSRRNPACMNPNIRIQNTGAMPLTSLTIEFGLEGNSLSTFQWTGNLSFMQSEEVILNLPNLGVLPGTFLVTVSNPNGGTDEYANNNTIRSEYAAPLLMPSKFIIELKSNSAPDENEYLLLDASSQLIHFRGDLSSNTIYRDTVTLEDGCYEFSLTDLGNDGLSWWANTAQGTGYIRFRNATNNAIIKTFNADFGGEVYQQFAVNTVTGNASLASEIADIQLFPNPATDFLHIDIGLSHSGSAAIEITDLLGKSHFQKEGVFMPSESFEVPVTHLSSGIYLVSLQVGVKRFVKRFVKW